MGDEYPCKTSSVVGSFSKRKQVLSVSLAPRYVIAIVRVT